MSIFTNRFSSEKEAFTADGNTGGCSSLDPLALYDCQSIGREFTSSKMPAASMRLVNEARRSELAMNSWKETSALKDSQQLPKAEHFATTRRFETRRIVLGSLVSKLLFFGIVIAAGVLCGLFLVNCHFPGG